jgi:3-oxoacyl-[acyl-carrier protein] reductase
VELRGARAIVTGASTGIGRAIALEFARQGASVVLAARNAERLAEVAEQIRIEGGRALVLPADVTAGGAVEALVQKCLAEFGGVDILVNNAGVGLGSLIADASEANVDAIFALNVLAAARGIRSVVPHMRAQRKGMVINISSLAGRIVLPRSGYYSATKFALTAIGDALRMEEADNGIQVMNVFPGNTTSDFSRNRLAGKGRAAHQRLIIPVPAERVARRIARGVLRNERNVYVSLFPDRLAVAANWLAGWAVSAVLRRWTRPRPRA